MQYRRGDNEKFVLRPWAFPQAKKLSMKRKHRSHWLSSENYCMGNNLRGGWSHF
ncbi:unnamed protein product [Brugia timori]|uniref:Uncharacterized protein n=1 Tax=Brugia timori TaxID=42155 RepID=A0A3P7TLZ9_9BILA|nr:unnamed protein product [Brugia timori]